MLRRRWLLRVMILCGALVGLAVGAWLAAHAYLEQQIRSQLAAFHDGRITIERTQLGLDRQQAEGITLWDQATGSAWVTIEQADFQLSLWEALRGQTRPRSVKLHQVEGQLRLDEQGKLLTHLPDVLREPGTLELPADRVELLDGRLTVEQAGRQPLTVADLEVDAQQREQRIVLRGEAPFWDARWSLNAELDRQTGQISGTLAAEEVLLDSRSLAQLPLVPRGALEGIGFTITTPVEMTGSWRSGGEPTYRLQLEPSAYTVTVAGKPWRLAGGGGSVIAEDGVVTAEDLSAGLWDGRVLLSASMDARRRPWQGGATVTVERLAVGELVGQLPLPKGDWPRVEGAVFGRSQWEWELDEANRTVRGTGTGQIRDPRLDGLKAEPVELQFELKHVAEAEADWTDVGTLSGQANADLRVRDAELSRIVGLLERWVPTERLPELAGRLSLESSLHIPLDSIIDPLSYQAEGFVELSEATIREVSLQSVKSPWNLAAGHLELPRIEARLRDQGAAEGSLSVDLKDDASRLQAAARFDGIPARLAATFRPSLPRPIEGRVSGSFTASAPWRRWDAMSAWNASGEVAAEQLRVQDVEVRQLAARATADGGVLVADSLSAAAVAWNGLSLSDCSGQFRLDGETLAAENLQATWNESSLGGRLQVAVAEPHDFTADVTARDVDTREALSTMQLPVVRQWLDQFGLRDPFGRKDRLGQADRLDPQVDPRRESTMDLPPLADWPLRGQLALDAQVRGTLLPLSAEAAGTVASPQLGWEDWSVERIAANWQLDAQQFSLRDTRLDVLGGEVRLRAELPWRDVSEGTVAGEFSGINAREFSDRLLDELPVTAGGELAGTFSVSRPLPLKQATATLQFTGLEVTADQQTLRGMKGQVTYGEAGLDIQTAGTFQQAPVRFTGRATLGDAPWKLARVSGRMELDDLKLRELSSSLPARLRGSLPGGLRGGVRGLASARLELAAAAPGWQPAAEGRVSVRDLAWDRMRLSETVEGRVSLEGGMLVVEDLAARLAGGEVRASLSLDLAGRRQGTFSLRADRLELATLARPWSRELPAMSGRVSVAARGSLGRQWRAAGTVSLDNGELADVPFELRRASFNGTFIPRNGNLETQLQLSSAQVASGRLTGNLELRWAGRMDLKGSLQVRRARLRELARATNQLRNRLSGRLDGQVEFQGTRIDSLESLEGTYEVRLFQSQALSLPALEALAGSLGVASPASETFGETVASGDFRRGILRVDEMTLESPQMKLYIDGTVTRRGRLDLDVTADTAQLAAAGVALGFLRPLDFLRRRLLFLHVGGSIRSPIVQPRTAELIEQELVLFFLPLATAPAATP